MHLQCPLGLRKHPATSHRKRCTCMPANLDNSAVASHRTGKGRFSFQSQKRAMPKNVQTTVQMCSFHMLVRVCSNTLHGEGNGSPLQYSCLENPMNGGAWWAAVHGVNESQTQLSDFTFTFHFHALERETATHSSVLAWRIPGTGKPGGLPSIGSRRVGHD